MQTYMKTDSSVFFFSFACTLFTSLHFPRLASDEAGALWWRCDIMCEHGTAIYLYLFAFFLTKHKIKYAINKKHETKYARIRYLIHVFAFNGDDTGTLCVQICFLLSAHIAAPTVTLIILFAVFFCSGRGSKLNTIFLCHSRISTAKCNSFIGPDAQ